MSKKGTKPRTEYQDMMSLSTTNINNNNLSSSTYSSKNLPNSSFSSESNINNNLSTTLSTSDQPSSSLSSSNAIEGLSIEHIFRDIYARATPSDAFHYKLKFIIEAITETLISSVDNTNNINTSASKKNKKKDTSTSIESLTSPVAYFGAFLTALETSGKDEAKNLFYLLSLIMPHLSPSVIRVKLDTLISLTQAAGKSDVVLNDLSTLRSFLNVIGITLKALGSDEETWNRPDVRRMLIYILSFIIHDNPKVRHTAHNVCIEFATAHHTNRSEQIPGPVFTSFLTDILKGTSQREQMNIKRIIPFLRLVLPLLPEIHIRSLMELIINLILLGDSQLTNMIYSTITELIQSPKSRLSIKFVRNLCSNLVTAPPSPDDHSAATAYTYALAACMTYLANAERKRAGLPLHVPTTYPKGGIGNTPTSQTIILESVAKLLPQVIDASLSNFESDRIVVHHATANALTLIFITCIDAPLIHESKAWNTTHGNTTTDDNGTPCLIKIINILNRLLNIRYQGAWPAALPLFAVLYRILGNDASPLMDVITYSLVKVREIIESQANIIDAARLDNEDDDRSRHQRKGKFNQRNTMDSDDEDTYELSFNQNNVTLDGSAQQSTSAIVTKRLLTRLFAAAIRAMGAHKFVNLINLTDEISDNSTVGVKKSSSSSTSSSCIAESKVWILPLINENAQYNETPLSFFLNTIYPIINAENQSMKREENTNKARARLHKARVVLLWSILPALVVACPDFATGFGVTLGKAIVTYLGDKSFPELPGIIGRTLETIIVRNRVAAGLPPVHINIYNQDDNFNTTNNDDTGLTIVKGLTNDDDDDENNSVDGGATVFGPGGVSVYTGGEQNGDPRHPLIIQAIAQNKDTLPKIDEAVAKANLNIISGFAKNYIPPLFTAYEVCVLGNNASNNNISSDSTNQVPLSRSASNERSRKVVDAIVAYMSVTPESFIGTMSDRLLKLLTTALETYSTAHESLRSAKQNHRAAETAAKKGQTTGRSTQATAAIVMDSLAYTRVCADRVCSLLTLAMAMVPSIPASKDNSSIPGPIQELESIIQNILTATDDKGLAIQKRAYNLFACMLGHHTSILVNQLADVVSLLRDSMLNTSASSRRGRLICLTYVIKALDLSNPDHASLIPSMLGEVLLCCKDANGKVRDAAFVLLVQMAYSLYNFGGEGEGLRVLPDSNSDFENDNDDNDDNDDVEILDENDEMIEQGAEDDEDDDDMEEDDEDDDDMDTKGKHNKKGNVSKTSKKKQGNSAKSSEHAASSFAALIDATHDTSTSNTEAALPSFNLSEFFTMILAGLAADTPHMRSATLLALGKLIYEFSTRSIVHQMLPDIVETVLIHLKEKAREVVTSVVSLVKVIIACTPPAELQPLLYNIIGALLVWSGERKERIKEKVRIVLERLIRKFDYNTINEIVVSTSPKDEALMIYLKKMSDRKLRRKQEKALKNMEMNGTNDMDDDEDEDDDLFDDGMEGDRSTMVSNMKGGNYSVVSGASSRWPGTLSRAPGTMVKVGGPGSRLTAITAEMRAKSAILTAAQQSLPPLGSVVDPSVLGPKHERKERTVISKLLGNNNAQHETGTVSGKTAKTMGTNLSTSGKARLDGRVASTMLRTDDDTPYDLLNQSTMKGIVGADPRTLEAIRRRQDRDKQHKVSFPVTSDGRMIVREDDDEENKNNGSSRSKKLKTNENDDDDDEHDKAEQQEVQEGRHKTKRRNPNTQNNDDEEMDNHEYTEPTAPSTWKEKSAKTRSIFAEKEKKAKPVSNSGDGQGWGMRRGKNDSSNKHHNNTKYSGAQYKGKGKGDIKTSGSAYQPFAYVPLGKSNVDSEGNSRFSAVMASTSKAVRANYKRGIVADTNISSSKMNNKKRDRED